MRTENGCENMAAEERGERSSRTMIDRMSPNRPSRLGYVVLLALLVLWPVIIFGSSCMTVGIRSRHNLI